MSPYDQLLVATDGSETASRAVEQALELAPTLEADLRIVTVVEDQPASGGDSESGERSRAHSLLAAARSTGEERNVPVQTRVLAGDPRAAILEDADEHDADVIVVGTHGRTGVRRWIMGSVAGAIVREAPCPVLTVSRQVSTPVTPMEDILVATDGRPGVEGAVAHGLDLAEATGATVHAVSVVDDVHSQMDVVLEAFETASHEATETVAERATARGLAVERSVEHGLVHEQLLEYAEDHDIDLIVVGTESRSPLERFVVGSVSQRVIGRAPAPVLTVRTRGSGATTGATQYPD